ncbi:PREDICTED: spermine oxidase-like [Amphimedon queenslandica]|uniref:Amine oxidase domain-containing protein n=1 Tax=Amphimedon queenslandica TaxID=400682 RepID=A0A1X7VLC1_AMPQE|nr:PREDICTED: spermine oxidase-like [Amphimedon queenslandica]|eukprot:XP_011409966.1 PREDICTED: spermine oxidase-like [Amphimedon queenslandica]
MCSLSSPLKKKVVIIGGGFAGIGAARTLSSSPAVDVLLLEASDKLGGRVHSLQLKGECCAVELGATVLHGEVGNSLYDLSQDLGVVLHKKNDSVQSESLFVTGGGGEVPVEVVRHYGNIITDLFAEMCECLDRRDWSYEIRPEWKKNMLCEQPPSSHFSYINERFQNIILSNGITNDHYTSVTKEPDKGIITSTCNDDDDPIWVTEGILDYWLKRERINNATNEPINLYDGYLDFSYPLGDLSIQIEGGYQKLVDSLSKEIPAKSIILNKRVTQIKWTPARHKQAPPTDHASVIVQCADGSLYSADHVIITVSLGVLKSHDVEFDPPLPPAKQSAISQLGMGLMVKVVFHFSAPFIHSKYRKIGFIWRENDRERLSNYPWVCHQHCLHRVGGSNVWVGWFVGDNAKTVQELPMSKLKEGAMKLLDHFISKYYITKPLITSVTTFPWGKDPLFQGSYSYCPFASSSEDRVILATPINGATPLQLLFAGEATSPSLYSTTNGAYDTGVREGLKILEQLNQNDENIKPT